MTGQGHSEIPSANAAHDPANFSRNTLSDEVDVVLGQVVALVERAQAIQNLRARDGRHIGRRSRDALADLDAELAALLRELRAAIGD